MTAPSATPPGQLTVTGLRKAYRTLTVLDHISFSLEPGTTTVVGGINGTGKSTLLRCLAGLAHFEGSVHLGPASIGRRAGPELRRQISYLPQSPGFPEHGTVAELLELFTRLRGADLADVPLPDDFLPAPEARVRTLSGGQQQRVALAAALLGSPRLVLLDEPTANLDHAGRTAVWKAIDSFTERGSIVVLASPTRSDLDGVVDRVIELDAGVIASDRVLRPGAPTAVRPPEPTMEILT
jgi:ABC-type multidrug transport system ATPase subunit